MNEKGILLESVLLIIVVSTATIVLSGSGSFSLNASANAVRDNYDLTTKWQNLRFLIDQETSNWVIGQIQNSGSCTYSTATPDFSPVITNFNASEPAIQCSANSGPLATGSPLAVTLSCTYTGTSGEHATYAKNFFVAKNISSSGTPPNCVIQIQDVQSGLTDYQQP